MENARIPPQRGSALFAVLPLSLIAAALLLLSMTRASVGLEARETHRFEDAALGSAQSVLAVAQARIKIAEYDDEGNTAIHTAMEGEEPGMVNDAGNPLHLLVRTADAEAWISHVSGPWYQIDAAARVGQTHAHIRTNLRERDTWARYYSFTDRRGIGLAGVSSGGPIHTNRYVKFYFPDREYTHPVTAVEGFYYGYGASPSNTTLPAGSSGSADYVPMPDVGDIAARSAYNAPEFLDAWTGLGLDSPDVRDAVDFHLHFHDTTYDIVLKDDAGAVVDSVTGIPLPESGVVFVPMDVSGLHGTINGRLTLATTGAVTLTGSLQYVDDEGDTAFLNGIPENSEAEYMPNPDYDGNSVLGIMANGSIYYDADAPSQMEHNAYFFSATGSFGVPNSSFPLKSTLRRLGGVAAKYSNIGAFLSGSGNAFSGFPDRRYFYDPRLASNPPPQFLELDRPVFTAFRVINGPGRTDEGGWRLAGISIGNVPGDGQGLGTE